MSQFPRMKCVINSLILKCMKNDKHEHWKIEDFIATKQ